MSCIKNCAKNIIYGAPVLLLRRARHKNRVKTAAPSKTQNYDGSEWWVIMFIHMMCNQKKNSTGLIDVYQAFARCDQIRLATKISGATATQTLWVKLNVGYWSPVGTIILLVVGKPNDIFSSFYIFFLLHKIQSEVNICVVLSCSGLLPLNWFTLRSSIRICIALVDHVILGYGNCQMCFQCWIWQWFHMHLLQHPGYCYQGYHWSKWLKHSCNLFPQRLITDITGYPF